MSSSHASYGMLTMRRLILALVALCLLTALGGVHAFPLLDLRQQQQTAGSDTNGGGSTNGGAQSAANAAQAAGSSIDTGSGGDRSTPATREQFAKLLSGTFFGCLISLFIGGAVLVQVWTYFERYGGRGSDKLPIKLLVAGIGLLSTASNAVLIHRIYNIHVANFGDFAYPLLTIGWELTVNYICIACMTTAVQLYYAHRVWSAYTPKRRWKLCLPLCLLIAYSFAGGVASGALSYRSGSAANVRGSALHEFHPNSTPWQWSVVFASWLVCCATVDVSLCVLLAWQLIKVKSPYFSTRHAVARLLTLSVETCLITVAFSIGAMVLFLAEPEQFYFLILLAPLGQVSGASLIATLMARPSIAREIAQGDEKAMGGAVDASDVDAFAERAPPSLAKPLVKRLMKREERRRDSLPMQVQMVTTIQQESDRIDEVAPRRRSKSSVQDDTDDRWCMKKSPSDESSVTHAQSDESYGFKTASTDDDDAAGLALALSYAGPHFLAAVEEEQSHHSANGTPKQPSHDPWGLSVTNKTPQPQPQPQPQYRMDRRGGEEADYFSRPIARSTQQQPQRQARETTSTRGGPPSAWHGTTTGAFDRDRDSGATDWSTPSAAYPSSSGISSMSISAIRNNMGAGGSRPRDTNASSVGGGGGGRVSAAAAAAAPPATSKRTATYGYL